MASWSMGSWSSKLKSEGQPCSGPQTLVKLTNEDALMEGRVEKGLSILGINV